MGIDFLRAGGRIANKHRTHAVSNNVYINMLVKVYISRSTLPESNPRFSFTNSLLVVPDPSSTPWSSVASCSRESPGLVCLCVSWPSMPTLL